MKSLVKLQRVALGFFILAFVTSVQSALASLEAYDRAILQDAAGGLQPLSRLTNTVSLTGTDRVAFDFGATAGDATFEFILEGDPSPTVSAYLAVGANANSNLRYELWRDTGQLGFTELGVLDYAFEPGVPSPSKATHVAYVWNAEARAMQLYANGKLEGTRADVTAGFAMPWGVGWLGSNPQGGEGMVGMIHRLTVYAGRVSEEVLQAHADAFTDVVRPPVILALTATPEIVFTPGSTTLAWQVTNASAVFLDDVDVTGRSEMVASPLTNHTFLLTATNAAGQVTAAAPVLVNPAPVIRQFEASRSFIQPGEEVALAWQVEFGESLSISPLVGDVTALTTAGHGVATTRPAASTTFVLTATSAFGTSSASTEVRLANPAPHVVISEFMADDGATLADETGAHSGWIEIHNPTSAAIDLKGYFLTDRAAELTRWAFPGTNLPAGAFLVVFASGENRVAPGPPLHTNFRLDNEGEYLALVGPNLEIVHQFAPVFPPQRPDISYGILAGDPTLTQYFGIPTPGAPNKAALPPPAPVQFSNPGGLFEDTLTVALSASDAGAEIRITLDGSMPGSAAGFVYRGPLILTNTAHVRAVAVAGGQVSTVAGASYIKVARDLASYTSSLPILIIDNFGAGRIRQKGWNSTGAGIRQVPRQTAVWATLERVEGASSFRQAPQMLSLVGIRGRGAYSTEWRQKPYSVEAVDESGSEVEVSPLGLPAHADWVLYYPDPDQSRDPTLLFNTFAYELSRMMGRYGARFRWVEAFVNEDGGELKLADRRGVYALMEKVARGPERLDFRPLALDGSHGSWLLNINRMDPAPESGWPAPNGATRPWFFHTAGPNRIVETSPDTAYSNVPGDDLPQQFNGYLNFDNPNGHVINQAQRSAIEGWFKRFEDVLYDDAVWRDPVRGYRQHLDAVDFVDYFIINVLTRNGDGLLISMFPWKGDDDKLRMGPAWDYNWAAYYISGEPSGSLMHRSEQLWYRRLFADPDFKQLYIDRWAELRQTALSNQTLVGIIDRQAADISSAKALLNGLSSTNEWSRRLTQMKNWLTQRANWIDSNYLRLPVLNHPGGEVQAGFELSISAATGSIYFTLDDSDPRALGGAIGAAASLYINPVLIRTQTVVKARVKSGANWSGLTQAIFSPPQDLSVLHVTEIMYNPKPVPPWISEELEFLELKNAGDVPLQLGGFLFSSGIEFAFPTGSQLEPGQFYLLARNVEAMRAVHPGVHIDGVYTGKLNNDGETLRLTSASGQTVFELTFSNRAPWPQEAAGLGSSVVPCGPSNSSTGTDWCPSAVPGGSPGADDKPSVWDCSGPASPQVVQPPLDQTAVPGATVVLSVAVTNTAARPITYRWQRNGEDLPGGTVQRDETICFLAITNASLPYTQYRVVISNAQCPQGVTSAMATLYFESDQDQDGQSDSWELLSGLNVTDPGDATLDPDHDGALNWQECIAGTNPADPGSRLKLDAVTNRTGAGTTLRFQAVSQRTYAVEATEDLTSGNWRTLAHVVAQPATREVTLVDGSSHVHRFYRLITPVPAP